MPPATVRDSADIAAPIRADEAVDDRHRRSLAFRAPQPPPCSVERRTTPSACPRRLHHERARASSQRRLLPTVIPIRRSERCVTTGPLPLRIMRPPVRLLTPLSLHHSAKDKTLSSSTDLCSSRCER